MQSQQGMGSIARDCAKPVERGILSEEEKKSRLMFHNKEISDVEHQNRLRISSEEEAIRVENEMRLSHDITEKRFRDQLFHATWKVPS